MIHFFHPDFRRCKIMDAHLEASILHSRRSQSTGRADSLRSQKLAAKYFDTLFVKANVANVPFLVHKMEVKVLPCVVGFVEGNSKMK